MSNLVGNIIAVPMRLIADALDFLKIADPSFFRTVAWKLSNDPDDGIKLLTLTSRQRGIIDARQLAQQMMAQTNDSSLAVTIAVLELQFGQGYQACAQWLQRAKQTQAKNPELLLGLELFLSEKLPGFNKAQLVDKILARNDLPFDFNRRALIVKSELFLEKRQWDSARKIADKILNLEEDPSARWTKWVTEIANGDRHRADVHFKKLKDKWPDNILLSMMALGWFYVGDSTQAISLMHRAEEQEWIYNI